MTLPATYDVGATVLQRGDAVVRATTSRELQRAVGEFVAVLRTITDGPPDARTAASLQLVQPMAEQVIETIEHHLVTVSEGHTIRRSLAEAIYEVRRALEGLDYWRRHYGL